MKLSFCRLLAIKNMDAWLNMSHANRCPRISSGHFWLLLLAMLVLVHVSIHGRWRWWRRWYTPNAMDLSRVTWWWWRRGRQIVTLMHLTLAVGRWSLVEVLPAHVVLPMLLNRPLLLIHIQSLLPHVALSLRSERIIDLHRLVDVLHTMSIAKATRVEFRVVHI
jgi:hypothetical protein